MAPAPVVLSESEQSIVNAERDDHPNRLIRRKMEVLWSTHCGVFREQSATVTRLGRATVQRYLAVFRQGGLKGLRCCGNTGPVSDLTASTRRQSVPPPKPATALKRSPAAVAA